MKIVGYSILGFIEGLAIGMAISAIRKSLKKRKEQNLVIHVNLNDINKDEEKEEPESKTDINWTNWDFSKTDVNLKPEDVTPQIISSADSPNHDLDGHLTDAIDLSGNITTASVENFDYGDGPVITSSLDNIIDWFTEENNVEHVSREGSE